MSYLRLKDSFNKFPYIKTEYYISEFSLKAAYAIMNNSVTVAYTYKEYKLICDISGMIYQEFPDEDGNIILQPAAAIDLARKANNKIKEELMIKDIIE